MKSRHKTSSSANRNQRLADQIQKDLAQIIQKEIDVKTYGLITLSAVELSADYAHAKVYFTVIGGDEQQAEAVLNEKAGWLHAILFKLLHIHTVPTLHFYYDEGLNRGLEVQRLIDLANKNE
ncbi:30S ribosome-binding factor RbfA [Basilea psittacipulmonis]|uniref:30S ribosome-binding factor RbfA n=1 Tax=Basilea psittacipulmonis TaxID=1472345 RepID=UPI00068E1036|nr:30S ribosome-binding factor RbfA [Basilea psittacipulmonis]